VLVALMAALLYTGRTSAFLPVWARDNYAGYEGKAAYPEFRELMETMGNLPPGRALWEPSDALEKYGTPLALELLPYFTHGRIASMEGLYFEAAATTPYHFLTVAEVAKQPANPVDGLTYRTIKDFDLGVRHMQLLGVRYFMAQSDEAKRRADANSNLRLVAETGSPDVKPFVARWRIYEVADSSLVTPLSNEPVVLTGVSHHEWLHPAVAWFDDPAALDRPVAADGPAGWVRAASNAWAEVPRRPLPEVTVSDIASGDDWVKFKVSRPGVPVLVKTSFFPNWQAQGAEGPWRVSPNLMVVVPTSTDVSLHYGRTGIDWAGIVLSLLGLAGLGVLARRRRRSGPETVAEPAPVSARETNGAAAGRRTRPSRPVPAGRRRT
jgi:hypothetical protein